MSYLIEAPDGKREYEKRIIELDSGRFQWTFTLLRVQDMGFVTNRGWQRVGPEFETRQQCARYLGWVSANQLKPTEKETQNRDDLLREYDALFSDALEFQRKPGRPVEREGGYQRITLEVRSDLLAKIDASGKSRREYIE